MSGSPRSVSILAACICALSSSIQKDSYHLAGIENAVGVKNRLDSAHEIDLALSCTDGLSNYLERDTLLLFISNYQGEELADELIRYANSKGGSDNVTVAVIENR